jgi:Holliday junction resolvase
VPFTAAQKIGDQLRRYVKGARSERELLSHLVGLDYSVMRSAGSGVNSISPDLIAFRAGKGYAFECKAWDSGSISIPIDKFESLQRWEGNTGMQTYLAWRMSGGAWYFIKLNEMNRAKVNYTVTSREAKRINRCLDIFKNEGTENKVYGVTNG